MMATSRIQETFERLRAGLHREAERWGVPPRIAEAAVVIPIVGSLFMWAMMVTGRLFLFITWEESIFEMIQLACWAIAAVLAANVAWLLLRGTRWPHALMYGGLAIGCIIAAGEEFSWGQRLSEFDFRQGNREEDRSLHNSGIGYDMFRYLMLAVGVYGSIFAAGVRVTAPKRWSWLVDRYIPPFFLMPAFFTMAGYRAFRFAFPDVYGLYVSRYGEWPELCIAVALLWFVWLQRRQLRVPEVAAGRPFASATAAAEPRSAVEAPRSP